MTLALLLLACSSPAPETKPPEPAPAAPEAPPPPDPQAAPGTRILGDGNVPGTSVMREPGKDPQYYTLLGHVEGVVFTGDWTSPSCGGRAFPQNLRFEEVGQKWAVANLVEPCPPGKQCSWSGMQRQEGIWAKEDNDAGIVLKGSGGAGSQPLRRFKATSNGRLVESGCVFVRGLTVPDGYTEEQVRPTVKTISEDAAAPAGEGAAPGAGTAPAQP
jgi:hypothetical protein